MKRSAFGSAWASPWRSPRHKRLRAHLQRHSVRDGWVNSRAARVPGCDQQSAQRFPRLQKNGYGLLVRTYIKWSDIEVCADDTVSASSPTRRSRSNGQRFEELNVKLVPRVFLDWNGTLEGSTGPPTCTPRLR